MGTKKKWESKPSHPKSHWVEDTKNPKLEFNIAKLYKIKIKGNPAEHLDTDEHYQCEHCKENKLFMIERTNKNMFKCAYCHSIIETGD